MFFYKLILFIRLYFKDVLSDIKSGEKRFKDYGMTLFTGSQGAGKTMSMVYQIEAYRQEFPEICIATNFGYTYETQPLRSIEDFRVLYFNYEKLGYTGLLIGWDELQNDYDSYSKVGKEVLQLITQQRKAGVKILATSQVFTRVAKPLREQTFRVVECRTLLGRWTFQNVYDADDYNMSIDSPMRRQKLMRISRSSFIQTDEIRALYDSYAFIKTFEERLKQQ